MLAVLLGAAAALFNDGDANAGGQLPHRRWKIDVLVIHNKAKHSPADATAEAVKRLPLRADMKGRGLFLMERTERLEISAGALERKIRTNHLNDIIRCGDLFDCLCWNRAH